MPILFNNSRLMISAFAVKPEDNKRCLENIHIVEETKHFFSKGLARIQRRAP